MKSTESKAKIPSSLYKKILNFDSNLEQEWILFLFHHQETTFVLDILPQIQDSPQPNIPFLLEQKKPMVSLSTIKINKQNKNQILSHYSECHHDEVNEITKQWVIFNFQFEKVSDVEYQLIGYQNEGNFYECESLLKIMEQLKEKRKSFWNTFHMTHGRSLKKKKQMTKDTNSCLLPMINFSIFPVISVIKVKKIEIRENIKPVKTSLRLFMNFDKENKLQLNCSKINSYVKEKIYTQSQQNQQVYLQKLSIMSNNSGCFPNKIINPHLYAVLEQKEKFNLYMVKGLYQYYHYGDQRFSDIGWGCAYRACQTLLSWMRFQGFCKTLKKIPTITEIQEKLDGFNGTKLKGSSEWIGATEISWLIPRVTVNEINCKILHVRDGKQILEKCEEFRKHLETVGCPIMYGGDQYAYSIVGMHYNWKYGECQFLILDPHYTGEDDYGKILEKKGLCWKKPQQLFKKGIFYNFLLPLVYGK